MKNLPQSEMIESCSVAGPGFVNVVLSKNWMAQVLGNCLNFYLCFVFNALHFVLNFIFSPFLLIFRMYICNVDIVSMVLILLA